MSDWEELWNEFHLQLFNYINRAALNQHDAQDILQEVFLKIFNSIEQLENPQAIKSWIYKITRNTLIDFYKKKKELSVSPETFAVLKAEQHDVDNMNDDIARCIKNMLTELPDKYQRVYYLHENKSMKHADIAKMLGISVSASKVRLKRSKDMFRDKLLQCCDFYVDKYGNVLDYYPKSKCDYCSEVC